MNKKVAVISSIIVLLVLGSTVYLLYATTNSEPTTQDSATITSVAAPDQENNQVQSAPPSSTKPGTYVAYNESEFTNQADTTRLLFFHAPWCPQCRSLDQDITASGVPTGVTIYKVDYDSNQTLRKKYGVTLQTTVVRVDSNGNLVEKYVSYDEPTMSSVTANLL